MSKGEVKQLHQSLAQGLLPKSHQVHTHIKEFLTQQINDFQNMNRENDKVLDQMKDEWEQYNRAVSDLKNKKTKDHKFLEGSVGYLKAKQDEISGKNKVLESITTGLKESVTKIKPQKLAELPYQKQPILKDIFTRLYTILYNQPDTKFEWETFKKQALLHYNGEDFITRMANINFKDLPQNYYNQLLKLKDFQQFKFACEHSTYAYDIVDLADWLDYVCEGQKISAEKRQCQHDYNKIMGDKEKRGDKTQQLKEDFCNQTLKEIDKYQNSLMSLQAELRTLVVGMNSSLNEITEIDDNRNSKITKVNSI